MTISYGNSGNLSVILEGPFGSVGTSGKITEIFLPASGWKNGESPFFQRVEVTGISESSLIELQLAPEQTAALCDAGTALQIENESGSATVWAIGTKPDIDLRLQVTLREVVSAW